MAADTPTPLATTGQMLDGPYGDLVRDFSQTALADLMTAATREIESRTSRRLAPFTGVVETSRLEAGDLMDFGGSSVPLPGRSQMGIDYARAIGVGGNMARYAWVREYPPRFQEFWSGSITGVNVFWPYQQAAYVIGQQQIHYSVDTGKLRFLLGTFLPFGAEAEITYSGGYQTVPFDLTRLCLYVAADMALSELDPAQRPDLDLSARIDKALAPWTRS